MRNNYAIRRVVTMDANDAFVYLGFCPDKVRVTKVSDGQQLLWFRPMGNDACLSRVAAGDITVNSDNGIKLVKFVDTPLETSSDPSAVDPMLAHQANGIQITGDVALLADNNLLIVEAWGMDDVYIKATHDGGDNCNTYFQDNSYDFLEMGVSGGQSFILLNITNGNYAYIGEVLRPAGKSKHCRLTLVDSAGNAMAAADCDNNDVAHIFPVSHAWYPLSDIGMMS